MCLNVVLCIPNTIMNFDGEWTYVCMYVHVYVYECVWLIKCVSDWLMVYVWVCVWVCVCVCVWVWVYVWMHVCMYVCGYVYMHHACVYASTNACPNFYIDYTCIHIFHINFVDVKTRVTCVMHAHLQKLLNMRSSMFLMTPLLAWKNLQPLSLSLYVFFFM